MQRLIMGIPITSRTSLGPLRGVPQ